MFKNKHTNKIILKRRLHFFWAFPFVLIWRFSYFLHKTQLIQIRSDRIGHFVADGAEQIARYNLKKNKRILFCLGNTISNNQWSKMLKKKLPIYKPLTYVFYWNERIFSKKMFTVYGTQTNSRDKFNLFNKVDVKIKFSKSENKFAYSWLEKFGFKHDDKFICLIVRDNEYLKQNFKYIDWNYHNYRNSDIANYQDGIRWLISKGYWVIRMGKINDKKIEIKSDKYLDFSNINDYSDLIDVWLFANCNGCITTGTGPDIISNIYNRPCLGVNWLPLIDIHSYQDIITYPKYLYDSNNRLLKINEYLSSSYTKSEDYIKNKIRIKELSSTQILNAFKEFYFYKLNKKMLNEKYIKQNDMFWKQVLKFDKLNKFHKEIHKKALISEEWIKSHY